MDISTANIEAIVADFRNFLGSRFEKLTGCFRPQSVKGLRAYQQHAAAAHPFAIWWTQLEKDVLKCKVQGTLALSNSSLFLLDLYTCLVDAASDPNGNELLDRLVVPNQFYSTMFEAYVFSAFRQRGAPITILPRSINGRRTADFKVGDGPNSVLVECKSLQDPSERESHLWFNICGRVSKCLLNQNLSWTITFTPRRYIRGHDLENIWTVAKQLIEERHVGFATISDCVDWHAKVNEYPDRIVRTTDLGWAEASITVNDVGVHVVEASALVQVERYFDQDESKRIQDALTDAANQIGDATPGIVYIEIPFRDARKVLDVADHAYNRTFGRLSKSYPNVACVGLVGRFVDAGVKDGGNPISEYIANIPNSGGGAALPTAFSVLGAESSEFDIEETGTVLITFSINEPLNNQQGRSLVSFCASNARRQFRLWQSYENCFRADVVHPDFGRQCFRSELNDLEVGRDHKLALSYDAHQIRIALDGAMLKQL